MSGRRDMGNQVGRSATQITEGMVMLPVLVVSLAAQPPPRLRVSIATTHSRSAVYSRSPTLSDRVSPRTADVCGRWSLHQKSHALWVIWMPRSPGHSG